MEPRTALLNRLGKSSGTPTFPWEIGPSGPRNAHGTSAGLAPVVRLRSANGLFQQPVKGNSIRITQLCVGRRPETSGLAAMNLALATIKKDHLLR